ncbi:MAG: cobyric acid synthase [Pseudoclavibacter sp.]|nr:cobyric acid synthase [Pseudoclavibacter sp.]
MTLTIVDLYPRELGINGDVGNVTVLVERAGEYGLEARAVPVGRGEPLPEQADLVHIGSGPLSAIETVLPDLADKAARLREWFEAGVPFLAISGGWDALGASIMREDGLVLQGAGLFPSASRRGGEQAVDETVLSSPFGTLAGFANHNSTVTLQSGAEPLGRVVKGFGNAGAEQPGSGVEGVLAGPSIGTHLHGTVLAMNPVLADRLLQSAAARTRPGFVLERPEGGAAARLDRLDDLAARSRRALMQRMGASEEG